MTMMERVHDVLTAEGALKALLCQIDDITASVMDVGEYIDTLSEDEAKGILCLLVWQHMILTKPPA